MSTEWGGVVENMPPKERADRLGKISDAIELALAGGPLSIDVVLGGVAAEHRIAVTQVKAGLNYALSARRSILMCGEVLSVSITNPQPMEPRKRRRRGKREAIFARGNAGAVEQGPAPEVPS